MAVTCDRTGARLLPQFLIMTEKINLLQILKQSESFVVKDYSHVRSLNPEDQPVISVVPADALFEIIQDAHKNNKKITISPVGEPIIDWI